MLGARKPIRRRRISCYFAACEALKGVRSQEPRRDYFCTRHQRTQRRPAAPFGGCGPGNATIIFVRTFHVQNFGCRATQADGAGIERQFEQRGLSRAAASSADFVILNTCTVTNSADQDARAAIRRVRRQNPLAKIVITGCYAQRAPEEIIALPGVTAVIGNSHKHQLAEIALHDRLAALPRPGSFVAAPTLADNWRLRTDNSVFVSDIFAHTELLAAPVFESSDHQGDRTRPNLKVQDGCDSRCSFCVIPSVRGQSRSLPMEQVIAEVNRLVAAGYRELVISGINLGRWGRDLALGLGPSDLSQNILLKENDGAAKRRTPKAEARSLASLIRAILAETSLEKLRISSVEPMDWTDELIDLAASSPRIAKHAHVPLQSGSDAALRRMHRKYRPWHYREKIEKIRAVMPTAAIGADVMVGFPGESDSEFTATRRLIEDLPFTYLHVFTYSARPGTPAAAMPDRVPLHVARERNKILRDLAGEKKLAFMCRFVGKNLEAITLAPSPDSVLPSAALTDNYQKLFLKDRHPANRWISVKIEEIEGNAFIGSVSRP
jgi:threonylcarbamoyladenosine tRNA methylthiotransferase MtaB